MKTFLQSPYFDDYDPNKKFYQILYRPSRAIQARELNSMHAILQEQIRRMGDHQFKDGAKVVDGQLSFDTTIRFVKLQPNDYDVTRFIGATAVGQTTGAKAIIVTAVNAEGGDPATLFVKFQSSGEETQVQEFEKGEHIVAEGLNAYVEKYDGAIDYGSIAQIERGIYYVFGHFVLVDAQTIILDKYSNVPTYRVGLDIQESIVTPEEDETLLDNANGSYNFNAPGAHRYKIEPILVKKSMDVSKTENFIDLGQIMEGQIVKLVSQTEYSELEKTLARRTYDESGDYTVRAFKIDVREHRSNDRGQWKPTTPYLIGDVVKNEGRSYVARTSGTSANSSYAPKHTSGTRYENQANSSGIKWEFTTEPKLNGGVYNAEGSIQRIEILNGGKGYTDTPTVELIGGGGHGAKIKAVVSKGKVIKLVILDGGSGYTSNDITVSIRGDGEGAEAKAYANYGQEDKLAIGLERGKAYVQGFEIEKVGTTYVDVPKARDYLENQNILMTPKVGNFVNVSNLYGLPPFKNYAVVDIYNEMCEGGKPKGKKIGQCRVRGIDWSTGVLHDAVRGVYRLYIFDVSLDQGYSFSRDVKGFYVARSTGNFSCAISPIEVNLMGTISVNAKAVTGVGTSFLSELKVGDYIKVDGQSRKVTKINSQSSLEIEKALVKNVNGLNYSLVVTTIYEPQEISNLYRLPQSFTKSVFDANIKYQTMESPADAPASNVQDDSCTVTFRALTGEFASEFENDNFILSCPSTGEIIAPSAIANNRTTITFTIPSKYQGLQISAMCTVVKSGTNTTLRRQKIVRSKVITINTQASAQSKYLSLEVGDAYRLISVKMCNKAWGETPYDADTYSDITDRYQLMDGQTETVYGLSKLMLKNGYNPPSNPIRIEFEYFEHTAGDYFTRDSYPSDIDYKEIPSFNGTNLRDCLDFRPLVLANGDLTGGKSIKRGTEFYAGASYYIGRRDKICLSHKGDFVGVNGISSLNPQYPETPSLSMNLYNLDIQPYTFEADAENVKVETIDNRRYTMRDIGKLEKRITNLEDYTTLSMLEQQTSNMTISDGEGYERFKQGFVVDNFKDGTLLSQNDDSLNVALDTTEGVARPPFTQRAISLTEQTNGEADRKNNGYKAYGKVFTLALDPTEPHKILVEQELASKTENVNPFAVATFLGSVSVNPSSDTWYETNYLPDVINHVEGNYLSEKRKEGTVWNGWQTTWTGVANATSSRRNEWISGSGGNRWRNTNTTTTYAQSHGESRTGIQTSVTARIDYEEVGDRIVSTSTIPYMRSRYLLVKAKGLKPFTRFYPFFDDVDIDYWCTPTSRIEYTPTSSRQFDDSTMTDERDEVARVIEPTKNSLWGEPTEKTCLDIGDVVTSRNLSAVVVGKTVDYTSGSPKHYLYVVNIKKRDGSTIDGRYYENGKYVKRPESYSFSKGDSIVGSISGATGTVISAEENKNHKHDPLVTNQVGDLQFLYWIPNGDKMDYAKIGDEKATASLQFRTGERVVKVNDDSSNASTASNSSGETVFSSTGVLNTRQKTINAVRNAQVVQTAVSDNRTVTNTWQETSRTDSRYIDPLAQTFMVEAEGGCFLSKVDLFFATKDEALPVTVQIRTVENGYPTGTILAFAEKTLNPDEVNISKEKVSYINELGKTITEPSYDTPTTFAFDSPVYVENGQEYAIVILSNSTKYRVWIAEVGGLVPNRNIVISKQPYNGVLFKSQNASTWTANQNQDLKFKLYRANFDKNAVANLEFTNNKLPWVYLKSDPFQTVKDKSIIRVWHSNHGFHVGSIVRFKIDNPNDVDQKTKNLSGTITAGGDNHAKVKGTNTKFVSEVSVGDAIYVGENVIGVVKSVDTDTVLTLHEDAYVNATNETAYVKKSVNGIPYESLTSKEHIVRHADLQSYVIELDGSIRAKVTGYAGGRFFKSTQNVRYDVLQPNVTTQVFSETPIKYQVDMVTDKQNGANATQILNEPIVVNENNEFIKPMSIYTEDNLNGFGSSLTLRANFRTTNPNLSPVIDSDRVSAVLIANNVDDPTNNVGEVAELDTEELTGCKFTYGAGIREVKIGSGGSSYTNATVTFTAPSTPNGKKAEGKAIIVAGSIVGVEITYAGIGYTANTPTICQISGDGSGVKVESIILDANQIIVQTPDKVKNVEIGKYINLENGGTNNGTMTVMDIEKTDNLTVLHTSRQFILKESATNAKLSLRNLYVDEIAPTGGTVNAKYITKTVSLSGMCNYLRIIFGASIPSVSDVDVYYKTYQNGGAKGYESIVWSKVEPKGKVKKNDLGIESFTDLTYEVENLDSFDMVAVKVVFRSSLTSAVPKLRDFRIVACA